MGGSPSNAVALTATTTTGLVTTRQPVAAAMAPAATQTLCFQVTVDAAAPSSLQGKTASATFTVTGTSDVS